MPLTSRPRVHCHTSSLRLATGLVRDFEFKTNPHSPSNLLYLWVGKLKKKGRTKFSGHLEITGGPPLTEYDGKESFPRSPTLWGSKIEGRCQAECRSGPGDDSDFTHKQINPAAHLGVGPPSTTVHIILFIFRNILGRPSSRKSIVYRFIIWPSRYWIDGLSRPGTGLNEVVLSWSISSTASRSLHMGVDGSEDQGRSWYKRNRMVIISV